MNPAPVVGTAMWISSLVLTFLGGWLLTVVASDVLKEINKEIIELRAEANHETYGRNRKLHEMCPKKILAMVPQKFSIKDPDLLKLFEQMKELLANITREMSITQTLDREILLVERFHAMMKFTIKMMDEDIESLSKKRLTGLASGCYEFDEYMPKVNGTIEGEAEVKALKDKMVEAEVSLVHERLRNVKEDRTRLQKFCSDRLKNITNIITQTFSLNNSTTTNVEETIAELEKELKTAGETREQRRQELFSTSEGYNTLSSDMEVKAYLLNHYKSDIECYERLKSFALKIQKPTFGHLLNSFDE